MNSEVIKKCLDTFQKYCEQHSVKMGYASDISQSIFSYIIEMRNIMNAVENHNTFEMHNHMVLALQAICNFANANNILVSDCIVNRTYTELFNDTMNFDFEHSLTLIKEDLDVSKNIQMEEKDKISYVQKGFVSIFPEAYFFDFIKIDRIINLYIESKNEIN